MISRSLIDWIRNSLPQLDKLTADELKEKIKKDYTEKKFLNCFEKNESGVLLQGDIIHKILLFEYDKNNDLIGTETDAIIISASCDVQPGRNKDTILVAPVHYLNRIQALKIGRYKMNDIFNKCFLSGNNVSTDLIIDFSHIQPYSAKKILTEFDENTKFRKWTLTLEGKYLFLTKLLIFIGRREDPNEARRALGKFHYRGFWKFLRLLRLVKKS